MLTPTACIDAMDRAMRAVSRSEVDIPPRQFIPIAGSDSASLGVMPGSSGGLEVYGAKILSLHRDNAEKGYPAIQGFVCLFDRDSGRPLAIVDGAMLTALRTAAASALATRSLARSDASSHGVFGTGVQAQSHIDAVAAVRDIERIVIWGRRKDAVESLAVSLRANYDIDIVAAADARDAAACDIVSTVTASPEPILHGRWVRPGAHINLVGAHESHTREADSQLISAARVYVDLLESALRESGDLLIPIAEGAFAATDVIGELGALLDGGIQGRESDDAITVYKSLGIVAQDLYAADYVVRHLQRPDASS